jgi:SAM-dependent methyltransferase/uncharacterized protein YbaR (Trm112 family)
MLNTTLNYLKCPRRSCKGKLSLAERSSKKIDSDVSEVTSGEIACSGCHKKYPIMNGVAILVPDVRVYLLTHVKGISRWVSDSEIPADIRSDFQKARREIETEHIEEDLEAERVTALYVMNHYLRAQGSVPWWKPKNGDSSQEIGEIIERFWDHGPFAKISKLWGSEKRSLIELGCGVGGLYAHLSDRVSQYLGVDSSFASIALARKLALGLPDPLKAGEKVLVPGDLLNGTVSLDIKDLLNPVRSNGKADFIVGDAVQPPIAPGLWDASAALNMIDMLDDPGILPKLQKDVVKKGGLAIQSSPYVWHPDAARSVQKQSGKSNSAQAVEKLYENCGFKIEQSQSQVPWLFFKHSRQLEIYSIHLFFASLKN